MWARVFVAFVALATACRSTVQAPASSVAGACTESEALAALDSLTRQGGARVIIPTDGCPEAEIQSWIAALGLGGTTLGTCAPRLRFLDIPGVDPEGLSRMERAWSDKLPAACRWISSEGIAPEPT